MSEPKRICMPRAVRKWRRNATRAYALRLLIATGDVSKERYRHAMRIARDIGKAER